MWFAVPIYLRCSESVEGEILFQETTHLIEADSEESAMLKSRTLVSKLEHKYVNVLGKEVWWVLDEIGEPWELLDDLNDGAELYSRFISEKARNCLSRQVDKR